MKKSDIRKLNRILTFIQVSNNPEWYTTVKNLIESFGGEFFNSGENNYLDGCCAFFTIEDIEGYYNVTL